MTNGATSSADDKVTILIEPNKSGRYTVSIHYDGRRLDLPPRLFSGISHFEARCRAAELRAPLMALVVENPLPYPQVNLEPTMQTITAPNLATLKLGQHYPEHGGVYFGILLADDGTTGAYFAPRLTDYEPIVGHWGKYGKKIEGADSYRDGLANTRAMAAAGGDIAIKTLALRIGDHDNWEIATNNAARLARSNAPEVMPDRWIWTSTQDDAHIAWSQTPNGHQLWNLKRNEGAVLPVRRLLVIE